MEEIGDDEQQKLQHNSQVYLQRFTVLTTR